MSDPTSILMVSSIASTVGKSIGSVFTNWIYHKYKKWRLRNRLTAVLLLKGCTTICQKLSDTNVLFFDIDILYRQLTAPKEATDQSEPTVVENFTAYPILRNHIFNLTNIYKNQIVIVSHSLELLRAVGIYENNITFYAFSKSMEQNISVIFPSPLERANCELTKFRMIREVKAEQVVLVDNLQELERKIKEQYHQSQISV